MIIYTKDNIPDDLAFGRYKKALTTFAAKMEGPFKTKTLEGVLECKDGYLALDTDGNPYPIDRKIFEKTYIEV